MLYPQDNDKRESKDLSGIWSFKRDAEGIGHRDRWFASPLKDPISMPVPASYNDITPDPALRDHIGEVWYERAFFVPSSWKGRRVCLRFASADHAAVVWVNGKEVARHRGGFLPFEAEITELARYGAENRVTVAIDNTLTWDALPSGYVKTFDDDNHPPGYQSQEYQFDFFNYSGLHRPVTLTATSHDYVQDITVRTRVEGDRGFVDYKLELAGKPAAVRVALFDEAGEKRATADAANGSLEVPKVQLWEPGKAYLYQLEVETLDTEKQVVDVYRLPVGVRTIEVTATEFLINGKPFYFKGCCKHEDMDIKGRGFDNAIMLKDFYLMQWLGAYSFRTSHYPYAEEVMQLADREGLVVIDEAPAVGMRSEDPEQPTYSEERISSRTLEHHIKVMGELIARDKNHPSVVMWSVANEPIVNEEKSGEYFREVIAATRRLDPTRPVTLVTGDVVSPEHCYPFQHVDVMCINRYHSWYSDPGHLELIERQVVDELSPWHEHFKKPLVLSEYGADTIAGYHSVPPVMFSEEYQCELLEQFHRGLDRLDFVIGEHVWNFADFATKQGTKRVMGNKKGVFTRQRQPKAAAHTLRRRWQAKQREKPKS